MYRILAALLAVGVLSGCANTQTFQLEKQEVVSMQGKTLVGTQRKRPGFAAITPGKAMFGALGAAAMVTAGDALVKKDGVQDPASYIENRLETDMKSRYRMVVASNHGLKTDRTKASELAREYQGADYVLDVRTLNWSFVYFPLNWNTYKVLYSANMSLIKTDTGKVVARGYCKVNPSKTDDSPSYTQLTANRAQRLKLELRKDADACLRQFRKQVFAG